MDVQQLAAQGWRLIAMQSGSKNPGSLVGENWPSKTTSNVDVVQAWSDMGLNFGVLLGSDSGIIDLEYDTDEGKEIIEEACKDIQTLSYKSAKSVHRLFKWDDKFSTEKAKFGHKGTEWRFGKNTAQSVIPPSIHESGVKYEWLSEHPVAELPESLWSLYLSLRADYESRHAKTKPVDVAPRDRSGDSLIDMARAEAEKTSWEDLLSSRGWTFCRNRGDAQDWWRPGKKTGSISATVNYGGSGTLRVFSLSCEPLQAESSYDKFAFQCVLDYGDDPIAAAKGIVPQSVQDDMKAKWLAEQRRKCDAVNLSAMMSERLPDTDDADFCELMIPEHGLLAEIAQYVSRSSYKPSPVFSLATAISFCQTIFGQKAMSETRLRTNDFHLVLAPTSSGKEGPLNAMVNLFDAAGFGNFLMPGSISGATAMLDCLEKHPLNVQNWVCDEFGYVLSAMLDKKSRDPHAKGIAKKMLELYGKSSGKNTGSAFSGNIVKHAMKNPHLCALGVSTGFTVFKEISEDQVHDGLLGRIAFWSIQERPKPNRRLNPDVPDDLAAKIKAWIEFRPFGSKDCEPKPVLIGSSVDAKARWEQHEDRINEISEIERAIRAALWGRTAARSMKLALTHRLARLGSVAEINEFNDIKIELEDVNWGIAVSNHCTRLACSMVRESVMDVSGNRLADKVLSIVKSAQDGISKAELNGRLKTADAGSIWAAVTELESNATLRTWTEPTKGRPKVMVGMVRGDNLAKT